MTLSSSVVVNVCMHTVSPLKLGLSKQTLVLKCTAVLFHVVMKVKCHVAVHTVHTHACTVLSPIAV